MSAVLFRTISLVEVVLRNRFHHAMSLRYGIVGSQGSKDGYEHVALGSHSRSRITDITHYRQGQHTLPRVPAPSPDEVVSSLTFGFWPHLLSLNADSHNRALDWGPILVDVLPGYRQRQTTYWAKLKHRDALFARLDLCNELHNRIAHHEPIWKLGPLMSEGRPRKGVPLTIEAPAPSTPADAVARLRLVYERVTELLSWLSPALRPSTPPARCICAASTCCNLNRSRSIDMPSHPRKSILLRRQTCAPYVKHCGMQRAANGLCSSRTDID